MALRATKANWRWWRRLQIVVAITVVPSAMTAPASVEASEIRLSREFQVKAVFLYNFAQFVEWPPSAFASPTSPLVIGVLGLDPFGSYLDEAVRGEKINGHPLVVRRYRWVSEIGTCHILFVSGSEGPRAEQVAESLRGRSILTVCDWEGFARRGGMIRFVMEHNHVRLRINLEAARAAGLTISSKLLRSAELVTGLP